MSPSTRYIDRDTACTLLAERGFNRLDIECVLDLAGPVTRPGLSEKAHGTAQMWSADLVERIASRAWWLAGGEISATVGGALSRAA